jgi:hypothetical protein
LSSYRRSRKFPQRGEIRMLVDFSFTSIIVASTFQRSSHNLSAKITFCVFGNRFTVPILPHGTSVVLVIERILSSGLRPTSHRNFLRSSHDFQRQFSPRNCTSFSATGYRESDGFCKTIETTITGKPIRDRSISRFAFPRAGATNY